MNYLHSCIMLNKILSSEILSSERKQLENIAENIVENIVENIGSSDPI